MPVPAGLGHRRQGEQVCPGSLLLQQALLSNAGVERLSCNTSLPLALSQQPPLPLPQLQRYLWVSPIPHRHPWGWGRKGQISPMLKPISSTPKRPLAPALVECGHREPNPQEMGSPCCKGRAGWVNPLPS